MRGYSAAFMIGLVGISNAISQTANPVPSPSEQTAATQNRGAAFDASWWFPLGALDERLPAWLHFGGEYRPRVEGQYNIKWGTHHDAYLLSRLRLSMTVKPVELFSITS